MVLLGTLNIDRWWPIGSFYRRGVNLWCFLAVQGVPGRARAVFLRYAKNVYGHSD